LAAHVQRVANVVRVVRPAVLHAASDFVNAVTAEVIGRAYGIPVVYESRGFWEESWLSRQAQAFGWSDLEGLAARHGLPDVYVWRRELEDRCRRDADHVVTLAEVMADRIVAGGVARERVTVVPNGVDVDAFPVVVRDEGLAARWGIGAGTTVVGYISSIVEYEGIDTLLAAYASVKAAGVGPTALLVVGDGPVRAQLQRQAAALGLVDAIFTGRVPHDEVLGYYSLIDVFVVPRKPVEVCHLVTPLKPFEAFSTGRTVVLSDVRALARVARDSGAAELFEAGDAQSLAEVLVGLLRDPRRRAELARSGASWVRAERTWAANAATYLTIYEALGAVESESVEDQARRLLESGDILDAHTVLRDADAFAGLGRPALRKLRGDLRRQGYLTRALEVARACVDLGGTPADIQACGVIEGDIAVLSGGTSLPDPPDGPFEPVRGRVLHVVGMSLPGVQTGYTLRTHYSAVAQRGVGVESHVVTQMGFGVEGKEYVREDIDGVIYHRVPGAVRGSEPWDSWLAAHVQRVANVVRVVRPAVLHAASDFVNAVTAEVIGRAYGIPVVYESRGFWEESWLSRQAQAFGWSDLEGLAARHGLPDVYVWRRELEDRCRRDADHVVTLAEVMADRIVAGGVARERVTVVPNGVDVDAFPVVVRDEGLAARWGIGAGTTVVGYISSIVEYEGIDTLLAAYASVKAAGVGPTALLVVGDGPVRAQLQRQAAALGLVDAIFTGRVPHDEVLGYYSLIDVFVVPRKPVEVCHLVTPLKPFEAFSTGRTVVLSDVRALARVARDSGAAELFEAGDAQSLAEVLVGLLRDPRRRAELARSGASWVRAERTWAANAATYLTIYEALGAVESESVEDQARRLLESGDILDAHTVLSQSGMLEQQERGSLRMLRDGLRERGYLVRSLEVAHVCVDLGGATPDLQARGVIEGDIAVLSGELEPVIREEEKPYQATAGRILHVVGGTSGETHETAVAQRAAGLDAYVVTEMGFGNDTDEYGQEDVDGVVYHRIPGTSARRPPVRQLAAGACAAGGECGAGGSAGGVACGV
jgi:glycosyltransferase involved in cell wall biosynthesis